MIQKVGSCTPILSSLPCEKVANIFCLRCATISLVPVFEGHKPKCNDIITFVVLRNSINKPLSDGHDVTIMIHKQLVRICLGFNGPLTKATCN